MPAPQDPQRPFERDAFFDDPGIVGARWWNRAFEAQMEATRRQAMKALGCFAAAIAGVAVLGVGGVAVAVANAPDRVLRKALDVQRQFGWNAGAADEPLVWARTSTAVLDRTVLTRLAETLKPKRHAPFHVATQLEALGAVPAVRPSGTVMKELAAELKPVRTDWVDSDYQAGERLAKAFAGRNLGALVVVDASGPRSVAFAAGAAGVFEPVLVLDNWPHPAGVVESHGTLGALAAYEPELAAGARARGAAPPPLFVLERERTGALTDPEGQFDNRYFATLPAVEALKAWSFSRVLLIVQDGSGLPEAGDVGVALASYAAAGIDVRALGMEIFGWDAYADGLGLFAHVPWSTPPAGRTVSALAAPYAGWKPGLTGANLSPRAPPAGFGQVYVYAKDGALTGVPAFGGTRDRASGGYGG